MTATHGALARCVADPERFLARGFGREVVHSPGADPGRYADLLALDDVDRLVTSSGLRAPAFRLVKGGETLPGSRYLRRARVGSRPVADLADPGRVYAEFDGGATIVLQGLQRYWPPLTAFCRDLELTLGHPVQANAYVTPPTSSGLRVHADAHDVFALQTFGRKHWVVYEDDGDDATLDTSLERGDALYLPQGTRHAARTVDAPSVHVTVGIRATTWADVLRRAADRAAGTPEFAERLPAGWTREPEAFAAAAVGQLARFAKHLEALDAGQLAAGEQRHFAAGRPPPLRGMLADLLELDRVGDDTALYRRPGTVCEVATEGERVVVTLGDRRLDAPAVAEPALRRVAATPPGGTLRPADLARHLDAEGRRVLVRRLVREGLLTLAAGPATDAGA